MYCPDKLKLNRFKQVRIPDNASYFGRIGNVAPSPDMFSGEDHVVPTMRQKLDTIAAEFEEWRKYCDEHENDEESS